MIKNWWKFVGAILLIFSFSAGLLIPLKPGIIDSVSDHTSTSEAPFKVTISGYNTHFAGQGAHLKVWLVNDTARKIKTCASNITVKDDRNIIAEFPPVAPLSEPFFHLAIYSDIDGLLFKPEAIYTSDTEKAGIVQSCNPDVTPKEPAFGFPFRYILYESIRNLYFHVPMWFTMIALLTWAVICNMRLLRSEGKKSTVDTVLGKMETTSGMNLRFDHMADQAIRAGLLFGALGLITGSLWARVTWGAWWVDDVKLNGTAITMLAYLAYIVLRNSIPDLQKRARIAAVYSIFAYVMMIALIGVLPRMQGTDSLHPGNGGNPAFSKYDLDSSMRMVFYPAVAGWVLIGFWIYTVRYRIALLKEHTENN